MKTFTKNNGFTLLEIMVVIIIVGVLATVSLVNYSGLMERQKMEEGKHALQVLFRAQKVYAIENNSFTNNIADLDVSVPPLKYFSNPVVAAANPIATISRTGGPYIYSLSINDQGTISCGGTTEAECNKIGMTCVFTCLVTP